MKKNLKKKPDPKPIGACWSANGRKADGAFDGLYVDDWFQIERMSDNNWYLRIGDIYFDLTVLRGNRTSRTELFVQNGRLRRLGDGRTLLDENH